MLFDDVVYTRSERRTWWTGRSFVAGERARSGRKGEEDVWVRAEDSAVHIRREYHKRPIKLGVLCASARRRLSENHKFDRVALARQLPRLHRSTARRLDRTHDPGAAPSACRPSDRFAAMFRQRIVLLNKPFRVLSQFTDKPAAGSPAQPATAASTHTARETLSEP